MTPQPERTRGAALISRERGRQIIEKLWTPEHDDRHDRGEMVMAAAAYASPFALYVRSNHSGTLGVTFHDIWPHDWDYKGTERADGRGLDRNSVPAHAVGDRIRELAKAGALIAAEIDRLERTRADVRIESAP